MSLRIGSVRLTERFLKSDPASASGLEAAQAAYVDDLLATSEIDFGTVRTWIGVAGTVITLAGVFLQLPVYDRTKVHRSVLPAAELDGLLDRLAASTRDEIRAMPSMHPQRADVITGGAVITSRIAHAIATAGLIVSERDILDGIALDLLGTDGSGLSRIAAGDLPRHHRPRPRSSGHHRPDRRGAGRAGMNLEDSSMTLLRGHFAMTLICAGERRAADRRAALAPARRGLVADRERA